MTNLNYDIITEVLGGPKLLPVTLQTELDLVELVRQGLTRQALFHLANIFQLTPAEIASIFHISVRTLQRYKQKPEEDLEILEASVSDRLVQLAELYAYGLEVLGKENFLQWVQTSLRTLGGKRPKELLFSSIGIDMVKDELTRIEYGVYA